MDLERLKSKRNGNRSVVTKLLRKIEEMKNSQDFDREELSVSYDNLIKKQTLMNNLNEQILDVINPEDMEEEMINTEEYTLNLEIKCRHIHNFLESSNPNRSISNQQSTSSNQSLNVNSPPFIPSTNPDVPSTSFNMIPTAFSASVASSQTHRLPKLTLPKFTGNILEWQTFWDSFESSVHFNLSLTDVQKFSYLQSQLEGEAAQTISGFALTNVNYMEAVHVLKERYGATQKIMQAYMNSLLEIPSARNELRSLRNFYDKLEASVRGLGALGYSEDAYGMLLVPIILNKLPGNIRRNLARENKSNMWNLRDLRRCLKEEIEIIEAGFNQNERENYTTQSQPTCTFLTGTKPQTSTRDNERRSLTNRPCIFCHEKHAPSNCTNVTDTAERMKIVRKSSLCFNCLGKHHIKECTSQYTCRKCGKQHHSSLCNDRNKSSSNVQDIKGKFQRRDASDQPKRSQKPTVSVNMINNDEGTKDNDSSTPVLHSSYNSRCNVILKTAVAPVWSEFLGTDANILFDEGAQRSFITEELAAKLKLKVEKTEPVQLSTFGNQTNNVRYLGKSTLFIETINHAKFPIEVLVVPIIATPLQNHIRQLDRNSDYLRGLRLAHPISDCDAFNISVLIGADYYWEFVEDTVIRGDGPVAVKSKLGYLLSGPLTHTTQQRSVVSGIFNVMISHKRDEKDIESFWRLESIGIDSTETETENDNFIKQYQEKSIEFRENQYVAKLPWKEDHGELPSNFYATKRRTENVIRRLRQDPEMLRNYGNIIKDQEHRGFIELVDENAPSTNIVHYIPHHPVVKDSSTTPVRVVYDCSFRTSADKPSLNNCLVDVPPKLNNLVDILIRFRRHRIAIATDIEKAFLHVGLHENDRDATRFLWLSDPTNPDSTLITYRFKSVLFGATSSPFILNATLLKHLQLHKSELAEILEKDLYVDNILSSVATEEEAIKYFTRAREMMNNAGFNLRSWSSNSDAVRNKAGEQSVLDTDTHTKVLGMRWNSRTDKLCFPNRTVTTNESTTKREILRNSSRIYDPLGMLTPVTVRAKLLMQDLWKQQFEWDEPLPKEICQVWNDLARDIERATNLILPRSYFTAEIDTADTTLHVFVDASMKAYGAVAYITNGEESSIVMSKSRVAPVKTLTLPQLELMAAVIGSRLTKHIMSALKCNKVVLWSDSQIVLHWLSSKKPLKRFIENRVREVIELTGTYEWKYCPTTINPADLLTRGITTENFEKNDLWLKGPQFLKGTEIYPELKNDTCETSVTTCMDTEDEHVILTVESETNRVSNGIGKIIDITRYGTLKKLIRVTAYMMRFISNCRPKINTTEYGPLETTDLEQATRLWIHYTQLSSYSSEMDFLQNNEIRKHEKLPRIRQLGLFLDEHGLIRCRGRIQNAPIHESTKHPYLLPSNDSFSELVVMDAHVHVLHSGLNATITYIRTSIWIPTIRQFVKKILHKCVTCRRVIGRPYNRPDPPPLPKVRLMDAPPFTITGVDFTGSLTVKDSDGKLSKAYICLFTCASTRAVHLEIVPNLTEHSFIQAVRRFSSRKSLPKMLISDNATTFIAGSEELKRLCASSTLKESLATKGIEWKFIPKRAPWYGGFWERLIALTKTSLRKVLGKSLVTLEILQTVITEIECILNDRPLTYPSSDIRDCDPITPAHLLYGRTITSLPHSKSDIDVSNYTEIDSNDIKGRVTKQTMLMEHFWARWKAEYLTSLREFHKTTGNNKQLIKVGDIVQIHNESPRVRWTLGIIKELFQGNDGLVRAARIKTKTGETTRPIIKLYPLEINSTDFEQENHPNKQPKRLASEKAKKNIHRWITGSRTDDDD